MADRIIPQTEPLAFTAARGVYQFCPEVSTLDLEDQLSAKQAHLHALLRVAGVSDMSLVVTSDASDFFWACSATAEEIKCLTDELLRRRNAAATERTPRLEVVS
jgi:hypothetical protein